MLIQLDTHLTEKTIMYIQTDGNQAKHSHKKIQLTPICPHTRNILIQGWEGDKKLQTIWLDFPIGLYYNNITRAAATWIVSKDLRPIDNCKVSNVKNAVCPHFRDSNAFTPQKYNLVEMKTNLNFSNWADMTYRFWFSRALYSEVKITWWRHVGEVIMWWINLNSKAYLQWNHTWLDSFFFLLRHRSTQGHKNDGLQCRILGRVEPAVHNVDDLAPRCLKYPLLIGQGNKTGKKNPTCIYVLRKTHGSYF